MSAVAGAVTLGRRTRSVIRANRVIGLATSALGLLAAGSGMLAPLAAAVFGVVGIVLVVANSLRVRGVSI